VVVKGWGEKESFFVRCIEQGETLESLGDVESSEFPDLATGWLIAEEWCFMAEAWGIVFK
jgi:hypothetical protein